MKEYSITSKQLKYLEALGRAYVYDSSTAIELPENNQNFNRCIKDIKEHKIKETK